MIILIGASASGKSQVCNYLISHYGLKKFITTTTRQKRVNETNNIDYHFISKDEFQKKINDSSFIEYVLYNGNYYGTEKKEIDHNKVLIVEPNGFKKFLSLKDNNIVSFYLYCDKSIREKRMISRKDNPIDIKKRLDNDDEIFNINNIKGINYIIDTSNKTVEETSEEIMNMYKERMKN
ncbi:MAG: AAA family ATPase [Bacilli bacterium]